MSAQRHAGRGARVLAFDVGGSAIKTALLDADGGVSAVRRSPTPGRSPRVVDEILDALDLARRELAATPEVIGLAVPGIVDDARGVAIHSENLGWRDVDFAARASARLGSPVALIQDVRAAALAELRLGAARGLGDAAVVTIGTGIAAGLVVGGELLIRDGYAGEIGHIVVQPDGAPCVCGARGCLEAVASAGAIARRYTAASGSSVSGARAVLERVGQDAVARAVWDEAVAALALGLSQLAAILAPQAIVLAGGLSEAGDALVAPLRERFRELYRIREIPIVAAELGGDAGVLGAALWARSRTDLSVRPT